MPAAIIPAVIGGVGSVAGGVASGKGASKAAEIQANAQAQQTAALQGMYNQNVARATPTFDNGTAAQSRIQTLLGLSGGDGSSAQADLAATPGYQYSLNQSMNAVNANAYSMGLGNSGAALKSLQANANGLASGNYDNYVNQLGGVANRGVDAMNGINGQGNLTTNAINNVTQTGANAASTNAVYQGNDLASILKGVTNAAGQAYQSSYANNNSPASTNAFQNNGVGTILPAGMSATAYVSLFGGR